jgi:hypothetical protein
MSEGMTRFDRLFAQFRGEAAPEGNLFAGGLNAYVVAGKDAKAALEKRASGSLAELWTCRPVRIWNAATQSRLPHSKDWNYRVRHEVALILSFAEVCSEWKAYLETKMAEKGLTMEGVQQLLVTASKDLDAYEKQREADRPASEKKAETVKERPEVVGVL